MTPDDRTADEPRDPSESPAPTADRGPDRADAAPSRRRRRDDDEPFYEQPHRGGMILAFGIVSLVMFQCGLGLIFGTLAWILGGNDLRAMKDGEMDPEGRSLTQAGRICGIIGALIGVLSIIAIGLYLVAVAAFVANGPAFKPVAPPPAIPAPVVAPQVAPGVPAAPAEPQ